MATKNRPYLYATHPGEVLHLEVEERGITQRELAEAIGVSPQNLNDYIKGKRNFSLEFSLKIEQALGIPAHSLMNLQTKYDLDKKRIEMQSEEDNDASEVEQSQNLNFKELYKRFDIAHPYSPAFRVQRLIDALGFDFTDHSVLPKVFAFKKSDKLQIDESNLLTWQLLAYSSAVKSIKELPSGANVDTEAAAKEIAEASNADEPLGELEAKKILNSHGIGYSVVEKLSRVPVDGYSLWVGEQPAIVVTHRQNDRDRMAFTILHELGHLTLHQDVFIDVEGVAPTKEEREANTFAQDMLIPPMVWREIYNSSPKSVNPKAIRSAIEQTASRYGVRPRIALQRYAFETKAYTINSGKAPKIW